MRPASQRGITLGVLSIALIAMAIALALSLVKIYLANRIYYESRETNRLEREVGALREENRLLRMQVEKLKYKTQVTDTIFTLEDNTTFEEDPQP